jgi:hypothetical protein
MLDVVEGILLIVLGIAGLVVACGILVGALTTVWTVFEFFTDTLAQVLPDWTDKSIGYMIGHTMFWMGAVLVMLRLAYWQSHSDGWSMLVAFVTVALAAS